MRKKRKPDFMRLIAVWLILVSGPLLAASPELNVVKANKAYNEGYYDDAIAGYRSILEQGLESPDLYYNLGNAFFKKNDMASAILYYEKARKLDPGNEDVNFNLRIANTRITDKIEALPELFYKRWLRSLVETFPVDRWARIGLIFLVAGLAGGLFYMISRRIVVRKAGFWSGIVLLSLSLLFFLFAWQGYHSVKTRNGAIVFAPTVTVKSSPDEKSIDLFVLHEGAKVDLTDNIGGWYEIRIANGSVGWLPVTAVEKI